jgi:Uma2 family endonuclease
VSLGLTSHVRDHRIPDVAFATFEVVSITEQVPIIAVEVLSRSTRAEDTIRKSAEYAADGIGQYWLVDRDQRIITALRNEGGAWEIDLELDDARPTGTVVVGEYGEVALDLPALLDR